MTSTNAGEGKTLIASNLAASMAMAGRRVLLVDADLRRPQLHQMFKIPIVAGTVRPVGGRCQSSRGFGRNRRLQGLCLLAAGADVASTQRRAGQPTPHSADREIQQRSSMWSCWIVLR